MSGQQRIIAFAGHRSDDIGDAGAHRAAVMAALGAVWGAFEPAPLLVTGHADGSDQDAIAIWRGFGGTVAIIHPFLEEAGSTSPGDVQLDGAAAEAAGTHPHLDQTRWLIAYADLLVAAWNGAPARGPGGTADAVALAVYNDLPVIWAMAGAATPVRLITADRVADQTELGELAAGYGPVLPAAAAAAIAAALPVPRDPVGPSSNRRLDRWLTRTLWTSYARFRRSLGGRWPGTPAVAPPADLASQPGFAALAAAFAAADGHANEQAAIHRSEQLLLILLAIAATAIGSSPLPKLIAVATELGVALFAFAVWWGAERAHRHERWGHARHDAEELRVARGAWAVGVRPWRGDRGVAAALPPRGALPLARRIAWARWGLSDLIDGQRGYHLRQARIDSRITERLEKLENATFVLLLATMTTVLLETIWHGGISALPPWVGDATSMIGALVPVIGAASMALEAKFGFNEHAQRSRRLAQTLAEIAAQVPADATLAQLMVAARGAIAALRAEGGLWVEGIHRRILFRGG